MKQLFTIDTTAMGPLPGRVHDVPGFVKEKFPGDTSWVSDARFKNGLDACFHLYMVMPRRKNRPEESVFWHKLRTAHQVWNLGVKNEYDKNGVFCREDYRAMATFIALTHDMVEDTRALAKKHQDKTPDLPRETPLLDFHDIVSCWHGSSAACDLARERATISQALDKLTDDENLCVTRRKNGQLEMVQNLKPKNPLDKMIGVSKFCDKFDNLSADIIDEGNQRLGIACFESAEKKYNKLIRDGLIVAHIGVVSSQFRSAYQQASTELCKRVTDLRDSFQKQGQKITTPTWQQRHEPERQNDFPHIPFSGLNPSYLPAE